MIEPLNFFEYSKYFQSSQRPYQHMDYEMQAQPWQQQSQITFEGLRKQSKQQQKVSEVQRFLSTVKHNKKRSNTSKLKRKKEEFFENIPFQTTDNIQQKQTVFKFNRLKVKSEARNRILMSSQNNCLDKNYFNNSKKNQEQAKLVTRKNITLDPSNIEFSFFPQQKQECLKYEYRNNFQKMLKLKQKIRKKKISAIQKSKINQLEQQKKDINFYNDPKLCINNYNSQTPKQRTFYKFNKEVAEPKSKKNFIYNNSEQNQRTNDFLNPDLLIVSTSNQTRIRIKRRTNEALFLK